MTTKTAVPGTLTLAALLLGGCNARYHLAGEVDGGLGTGAAGNGGSNDGAAGAIAVPGSTTNDAPLTLPTPSPLSISAREALTRVARVLWESPPDSALVAMADSGAVKTDEDVRRIAGTMVADPRARVGVGHFYRWWLNLDGMAAVTKDAALFPTYSPMVGVMMAQETEAFGTNVTLDGDGRFPTLMLGSFSFLNETLAGFYGVGGVTGPDLRKVDLDPTQRAGIFTQLAFLTQTAATNSWTSPSKRGLVVGDKMLCMNIPTGPVGVGDSEPPPDSTLTNRERLTTEVNNTICVTCHRFVDPLGFGYEGFDSIGRVRLTDAGKPIDASGSVRRGSDDIPYNGPIELAQLLANSFDAHRCMGSQWLQYMLGRPLSDSDLASATGIHALFEAANLDLKTVVAAAASSPSFLAPQSGTPCTPGVDQTCNDNPKTSSLHGTCTPDGKCTCGTGYPLNTMTGRCQ